MKSTTWFLFAVAIAVIVGVLAMVTRQATITPEDFFRTVETGMAEGRYDGEQSVRNLDQVLERAVDVGDMNLAARVQLKRGRALMELGALDRARADLTAVAAMLPADLSVENDLVDLEARSGDFRAAQERVKRLLEANPNDARAYVRLGQLHMQSAERAVARAHEGLARVLVPDTSDRARTLLEFSSALFPSDPRRVAIGYELREMLAAADEVLLEEAINAADAAGLEVDGARDAFTRSLEHGVEADAVAALVDLYERAGKPELAVDLASTTIQTPSVRENVAFARTLLRALKTLGRWNYAADVAIAWTGNKAMTGDFAAECCEVLWQAKRWDALRIASDVLRSIGTTSQTIDSYLYLGLAIVELGGRDGWRDGRQYLQPFLTADEPDPFPGARAFAWHSVARASRELGEPVLERTALQGQIDLAPELDGESWLRLAELQMASPHGGYRVPEMRFARGMSLMPERTAELSPRWHEIGVLELRSVGLDIEAVREDLVHRKIWTPSPEASSYELYRLAEVHADQGDLLRASAHVKRLLDIVPGFVPGLDLAIRIADAQENKSERMSRLIERVRKAGRTPAIDAILREIPLGEQEPRDLLELMRADPDRSGRLALADDLARQRRPNQALALVEKLGLESLGEEGRVLVARLFLARREPERALQVLSQLGSALFVLPDGIELYVRAGLGAGDHTRMAALSASLAGRLDDARGDDPGAELAAERRPIRRERALRIVDQFLAAGDGEAALPIVEALDSIPKLRGGDVLLRLVCCAVLRGELDEAHLALERAQAFDTKGSAEFMALCLAAFEGRVDDLQPLASAAIAASYETGPLGRAQIALLSERFDDARSSLDSFAGAAAADDPWLNLTRYAAVWLDKHAAEFAWPPFLGRTAPDATVQFFTGADGKQDPRLALAWVCAARQPLGAPFARAWCARSRAQGGATPLWVDWIQATLEARAGLEGSALEALARLRTHASDFGPLWRLEASILDATERTEQERAETRARRVAALGPLAGDEIARRLEEARASALTGQLTEATALAEAAVAFDPSSAAASVELARLQARLGYHLKALRTLHDVVIARSTAALAAPVDPSRPDEPDLVAEYLNAIERARTAAVDPLPAGRATTLIETLSARLPDDPRVALAAAEVDLSLDRKNPALGVARAYARLERFRALHKDVALERLGAGSVRGWARFYGKLEPARARAFVEAELALAPTVLSSWIELARAMELEGDTPGALRQLQTTARLSPQGSVLREILRLRGQNGLVAAEIDASAREILAVEGRKEVDPELTLLCARCYMNLGRRGSDRAVTLLDGLSTRHDLERDVLRRRALLAATALLTRGKPEDMGAARATLDSITALAAAPAGTSLDQGDRYEAGLLAALRGLASR